MLRLCCVAACAAAVLGFPASLLEQESTGLTSVGDTMMTLLEAGHRRRKRWSKQHKRSVGRGELDDSADAPAESDPAFAMDAPSAGDSGTLEEGEAAMGSLREDEGDYGEVWKTTTDSAETLVKKKKTKGESPKNDKIVRPADKPHSKSIVRPKDKANHVNIHAEHELQVANALASGLDAPAKTHAVAKKVHHLNWPENDVTFDMPADMIQAKTPKPEPVKPAPVQAAAGQWEQSRGFPAVAAAGSDDAELGAAPSDFAIGGSTGVGGAPESRLSPEAQLNHWSEFNSHLAKPGGIPRATWRKMSSEQKKAAFEKAVGKP